MYSVLFYIENDKNFVKDFILNQDIKTQETIYNVIRLLREFGNELRAPYSKYLEDGIFELRCKGTDNQIRILYFFIKGRKVVLTNAFVKKQQKTPAKEIELAKKRRQLFLEEE